MDPSPDNPQPFLAPPKLDEQAKAARAPMQRALGHYEDFLIPWLACWLGGNALAYWLPAPMPWPIPLSLIVMLVGVLCLTQERRVLRAALLLMAVLTGLLCYQARVFQPDARNAARWADGRSVSLQGVISEQWPEKEQAALAVQSLDGKKANGTVLVYDAPVVPLATTVQVRGELSEAFVSTVPGTFNQKRYLADQGITAVLRNAELERVVQKKPTAWQGAFLRHVGEIRARIIALLSCRLPSPESEIVGGIVLGHHAVPLDPTTKQEFARTGLIHILAASGLNVGIIAAFVMAILSRFRAGLTVRLLAAMGAVAIYAVLTGLPPSIQRAAAMLELALVLKLLNRRLSGTALLLIATSALVLLNPGNIGSLGFQFSVLTTYGLIAMVPPLQEFFGRYITRWAAGLILVPLVAQLWVLPLSVYAFNQFPLHSVPLNIVALVLVTPLTMLGFSAGGLMFVNETLAGWLISLCGPLVKALLWLVHWGDGMRWAQSRLPSPEPWLLLGLYGFLLGGVWLLNTQRKLSARRRWGMAGAYLLMLGAGVAVSQALWVSQAQVVALPVSDKRMVFLLKPAHSRQVVVAAPRYLAYWEGRTVSDYLRHRNIQRLHALVLWPESARFVGKGVPAGLPVIQEGRAISHVFAIGADVLGTGVSPLTSARTLAPGSRLRVGNLTLGARADELFRIDGPGLCLRGIQVGRKSSAADTEPCIEYLEPRRDFAYHPMRFAGQMFPGFQRFILSETGVRQTSR